MVRSSGPYLLFVLLTACGGGGGGVSPAPTTTHISSANFDIDGWIANDGTFSSSLCGVTGDLDGIANGVGYRQFLSFGIGIGSGVEIVSALLAFYVEDVQGQGHGDLVLDHVDVGPALNLIDFGFSTLASNIGVPRDLTGNNFPGFYWYLDVTPYVLADRAAARPRSQFRARFANFDSDADNQSDFVRIDMDGCGIVQPPLLILETR